MDITLRGVTDRMLRAGSRIMYYGCDINHKEIVMPEQETPRKPPVPNQQPDPKPEDDK